MRWWLTLGDLESDEGRILELTEAHGRFEVAEVLRYRAQDDRRVTGKGFTGGEFGLGHFFVTDFNTVYRIDARGRIDVVAARHDFNDLHHVAVVQDRLWVTYTGLDRIDVLDVDGGFVGGFALCPSDDEHERRSDTDAQGVYFKGNRGLPFHRRKVQDKVHPNHVGLWRGKPVVTRLRSGEVQRLDDFSPLLTAPGHPHDGQEHDLMFWVTCTNGLVLAYGEGERAVLEPKLQFDLFASSGVSGWCRGLAVSPDRLLVGLTRMAYAPDTYWSERPHAETTTAVLVVDRASGRLLDLVDLNAFGVHPKLFSIVAVPEWFT